MPNHVHLLLYFDDNQVNLNTMIANGKRFMAYELIKRLQSNQHLEILAQLAQSCTVKEKAKSQLNKAFEPSFDAKPIYTYAFLQQKLDYIHHNPVSGKWNLCTSYTNYPHSSAAWYMDGKPHEQLMITDYRELGWADTWIT
ncbi:hypothetical protein HH214_10620 [Mucilaginibacter robiniae]|uniref:Transposase IS200-like domain-containing protein n=2 Tax=Mucilaginibacter robiniae TaxID=2728022 RepID=A0A7L5E603_9SPHI|nr:hypothetical protein HH214_10620 [Mucilaginibacter robiniae]